MLTAAGHDESYSKGVRVMGLSPGTVATDMMMKIKNSGVNPVSQLDWGVHVPPEWVAEGIAYLCTPAGDHYVGRDLELRSEEARRLIGLI
jgi:NAD(P)-dependent dehydrogenase (short-subunit alcohol dehydrogenase family)